MPLTIKLGESAWEAVALVRNLIEDAASPFVVSDAALQVYAESVTDEFSLHIPLDYVVGNAYAATSPLLTTRGVQRYVCTSGAGFSVHPHRITDVLYAANLGYSAGSEIAYLALLPFSPVNRFLVTPNLLDSPSERVLRDEYLNELSHYGQGYYSVVRDPATGRPALDLFPTPGVDGLPIYVRYQGGHVMTPDGLGGFTIATVPEPYKRHWAMLLYAMVLEQESERLMKAKSAKSGITELQTDPRLLDMRVNRIRADAIAGLGGMAGVVATSN